MPAAVHNTRVTSPQVAAVPPAPMLAAVAPLPKDATGWCAELKWDGARGIAYAPHRDVFRLYSRRGNDLSGSFPELREALQAGLGARNAILDGEIVALDSHARPSFQRLQRRLMGKSRTLVDTCPATLFLFDILSLDGTYMTRPSLRRAPRGP